MLLNRNCLNLQYLSLAYCNRVTDEGFLCLAKEKVCYNLIYLDLSGCTQVSGKSFSGFRLQPLRSLGLRSTNPGALITRVLARSWLRSLGAQSKWANCEEGRQDADKWRVWFTQPLLAHPLLPRALSTTEHSNIKNLFQGLCTFQMFDLNLWSAETMSGKSNCPGKVTPPYPWVFSLLPQMTVNGFMSISAGCRLLREVVINDMPTLSDRCVLVRLHWCF